MNGEFEDRSDYFIEVEIQRDEGLQRIAALEAELAALSAPMECGHEAKYAVGNGDIQWCILCEYKQSLFDVVNERDDARRAAEIYKAALQEQITFKGNNPFVSHGDFEHLYNLAREALEKAAQP